MLTNKSNPIFFSLKYNSQVNITRSYTNYPYNFDFFLMYFDIIVNLIIVALYAHIKIKAKCFLDILSFSHTPVFSLFSTMFRKYENQPKSDPLFLYFFCYHSEIRGPTFFSNFLQSRKKERNKKEYNFCSIFFMLKNPFTYYNATLSDIGVTLVLLLGLCLIYFLINKITLRYEVRKVNIINQWLSIFRIILYCLYLVIMLYTFILYFNYNFDSKLADHFNKLVNLYYNNADIYKLTYVIKTEISSNNIPIEYIQEILGYIFIILVYYRAAFSLIIVPLPSEFKALLGFLISIPIWTIGVYIINSFGRKNQLFEIDGYTFENIFILYNLSINYMLFTILIIPILLILEQYLNSYVYKLNNSSSTILIGIQKYEDKLSSTTSSLLVSNSSPHLAQMSSDNKFKLNNIIPRYHSKVKKSTLSSNLVPKAGVWEKERLQSLKKDEIKLKKEKKILETKTFAFSHILQILGNLETYFIIFKFEVLSVILKTTTALNVFLYLNSFIFLLLHSLPSNIVFLTTL